MVTQGGTKARGKAPPKAAGKNPQGGESAVQTPPGKVAPGRSPLAPSSFASLPPLAGVRLATGRAGIKYRDRTDVLMMVLAPNTQLAGVFTKSKTASAPVDWCRKQLATGTARVLIVNSGNANAFTGKAGAEGVREVAESAAGLSVPMASLKDLSSGREEQSAAP